jgi:hypothetical protein
MGFQARPSSFRFLQRTEREFGRDEKRTADDADVQVGLTRNLSARIRVIRGSTRRKERLFCASAALNVPLGFC